AVLTADACEVPSLYACQPFFMRDDVVPVPLQNVERVPQRLIDFRFRSAAGPALPCLPVHFDDGPIRCLKPLPLFTIHWSHLALPTVPTQASLPRPPHTVATLYPFLFGTQV